MFWPKKTDWPGYCKAFLWAKAPPNSDCLVWVALSGIGMFFSGILLTSFRLAIIFYSINTYAEWRSLSELVHYCTRLSVGKSLASKWRFWLNFSKIPVEISFGENRCKGIIWGHFFWSSISSYAEWYSLGELTWVNRKRLITFLPIKRRSNMGFLSPAFNWHRKCFKTT